MRGVGRGEQGGRGGGEGSWPRRGEGERGRERGEVVAPGCGVAGWCRCCRGCRWVSVVVVVGLYFFHFFGVASVLSFLWSDIKSNFGSVFLCICACICTCTCYVCVSVCLLTDFRGIVVIGIVTVVVIGLIILFR